MHVLSDISKIPRCHRGDIPCVRQIDHSLLVNQISGGGVVAVVAPLAYFPPFTSQFILLGTLEVH